MSQYISTLQAKFSSKSIIKCIAHRFLLWEDFPLPFSSRLLCKGSNHPFLASTEILHWHIYESGPSLFILLVGYKQHWEGHDVNWERSISTAEVGELGMPLTPFTIKSFLQYSGLFCCVYPKVLLFGGSVITPLNEFHGSQGHLVPHGQSLLGSNNRFFKWRIFLCDGGYDLTL